LLRIEGRAGIEQNERKRRVESRGRREDRNGWKAGQDGR
jgi:hypothetical protein